MEIVITIFSGPVLPATLLLGVVVGWSLLAMLGAVELDMPGADLDLDIDVDVDTPTGAEAVGGLGIVTLRWLNLKEIPMVIWMGAFASIWWFTSACLWSLLDAHFFSPPGWFWSTLLVARNLAISLPITKFVTNPMKKWFITERLNSSSIVGQEGQISSLQATSEFGQVRLKTDGSPLLLNVRTDGPHLVQGTRVWLTHYDAKHRVYIVSPTTTDAPSTDSVTQE